MGMVVWVRMSLFLGFLVMVVQDIGLVYVCREWGKETVCWCAFTLSEGVGVYGQARDGPLGGGPA